MVEQNSPAVFISYSWDDEEHIKWVTKLACEMYANGVDALIDRFEVFPGSNLENYMQLGLNNCRWVICVCSDQYILKMDDLKTGVGKETNIIQALGTDFMIPVLKNNSNGTLPERLKGIYYIDFDNEEYSSALIKLLMQIRGISKDVVPIKGANPFDKAIVHQRILEAEIQASTYISPDLEGKVSFDYSNNSGQYIIGTGKYSFATLWSKASKTAIHAYNDANNIEKIALVKPLERLEDFTSTADLNFTSRTRTPKVGEAIVWINTSGNIAITRILEIEDDTRGDKNDRVAFDYRIFIKPI